MNLLGFLAVAGQVRHQRLDEQNTRSRAAVDSHLQKENKTLKLNDSPAKVHAYWSWEGEVRDPAVRRWERWWNLARSSWELRLFPRQIHHRQHPRDNLQRYKNEFASTTNVHSALTFIEQMCIFSEDLWIGEGAMDHCNLRTWVLYDHAHVQCTCSCFGGWVMSLPKIESSTKILVFISKFFTRTRNARRCYKLDAWSRFQPGCGRSSTSISRPAFRRRAKSYITNLNVRKPSS